MRDMTLYEQPPTTDGIMWDLWMSLYALPTVTVADELGLFSALAAHPSTADQLARRLEYDPRAMTAILRVLASNGLLAVCDGRYHATDAVRQYLLPESPAYWGPVLTSHRGSDTHRWLVGLLTAKATAVRRDAIGSIGKEDRPTDAWASGQISADLARSVAAFMHAHSFAAAVGAARNLDLSGIERLLDVGGGSGVFAIAFAQRNPTLRCTVMDLGPMCEIAKEYIGAGDVGNRVGTLAVDMFRMPWPEDHDALFFSNIFHDWDFETAAWLARRAFEALPKGGRILVHEMLMTDDGAGPSTTVRFSMHMLLTRGQQYTFQELRGLLEGAGFSGVTMMPTYGYYSVVTGYRG
jgi:acetylserotonin N-methyltransferase